MKSAKPRKPIPTNAATISFAFFEGAILSFPVGNMLSDVRPFTPPAWTAVFYFSVFAFSALALPIWALMNYRDLPVLAVIAFLTALSVVGMGLLLPALH